MTREEAIKGLETLSKYFSGYKPNEEMFEMAISALKAQDATDTNVGSNGDTIYRQMAIDAILHLTNQDSVRGQYEFVKKHGLEKMWSGGIVDAIDAVIAVPPAQPEPCEDTVSRKLMYELGATCIARRDENGKLVALGRLDMLPSAQQELPFEIQDILDYLDTALHPIISPEHWNVYSELHDMISMLPSTQPDNSCDGCKYENADDGVLVPCGFCKRSHPDNYERRTDERQT